jgi:transcriptional regulator with XRE-family HTH domain
VATAQVNADVRELGADLRTARLMRGLTLRAVATSVGVGSSTILRTEQGSAPLRSERIARHAAAVGMRLRIRAYPAGPPIRDAGQVQLIRDFRTRNPGLRLRLEVPVAAYPGDLRAFDAVAELGGARCAIEFVTRFHDAQAQLRAAHVKQADARVDRLVLVVRGSHANRRAVAGVRGVLDGTFCLATRSVLAALAACRDPGENAIVFL